MSSIHFLTAEQLCTLLSTHTAKYNSQHSIDRHYILTYRPSATDDHTFEVTNETFAHSIKQGESHASCVVHDDGSMTVHYHDVFESPHLTSPFHPDNSFYPRLFSGYTIGPFYVMGDRLGLGLVRTETQPFVIPLMYNTDDHRTKTLFFYQ